MNQCTYIIQIYVKHVFEEIANKTILNYHPTKPSIIAMQIVFRYVKKSK
jgi:hypothetical protein